MKKFAGILLILVGACGAAAYTIDLAQFTDPTKGFSVAGAVWLRYALVAALILIAALASLMAARRPAAMEKRNLPLALGLAVCGAACAAVGALELLGTKTVAYKAFLLGILGLAAAWWMLTLCAHWGSSGARRPVGGIRLGIAGSTFFLALTLVRFAGNYSSVYRFAQTMQTFSALAALLLSSILLRVGFFPESRWGRKEYMTGMWAFYLCTCCEVPQGVARYLWGQTPVSELAFSLLLGCIGLLGAGVALSALGQEAETAEEA
ncbi:MAG: hypothetical protein LKJ90_04585 [Faecalibacterium sp.]|jgi:hypothetical protein|nr:hypothetical protein [Faecalibacterium sp.]